MTGLNLQPPRPGAWAGIYVEQRALMGSSIWAVVISRLGRAAEVQLFEDRDSAYSLALEESERLELPVFDNFDPGAVA